MVRGECASAKMEATAARVELDPVRIESRVVRTKSVVDESRLESVERELERVHGKLEMVQIELEMVQIAFAKCLILLDTDPCVLTPTFWAFGFFCGEAAPPERRDTRRLLDPPLCPPGRKMLRNCCRA